MIAGGRHYIRYGSRSDVIRLTWSGDWHKANKGCALDLLKADLRRIADDDHSFFLGGGDYAEMIGYQDRRFDPEAFNPDAKVRDLGQLGRMQMAEVRDLMLPLKRRIVGLVYGNHEAKYMASKDACDLHGWLCTELGAPNFGYSCVFDIMFQRVARLRAPVLTRESHERAMGSWRVRVFAHHGAGYANTPGGKLNKLIAAMDYFPGADLVLLAHVHDEIAKRTARLDADDACAHLVHHDQVGAICGSYMRTYAEGMAGYGEMKLYRPVPLGATAIIFEPDKKRMRVEV